MAKAWPRCGRCAVERRPRYGRCVDLLLLACTSRSRSSASLRTLSSFRPSVSSRVCALDRTRLFTASSYTRLSLLLK